VDLGRCHPTDKFTYTTSASCSLFGDTSNFFTRIRVRYARAYFFAPTARKAAPSAQISNFATRFGAFLQKIGRFGAVFAQNHLKNPHKGAPLAHKGGLRRPCVLGDKRPRALIRFLAEISQELQRSQQ
jgi:hypothetical protein